MKPRRAREIARRVGVWGVVVLYFIVTTWALVVQREPTGLLGFFAYPLVGAVILTSRPGNGVGRFLLGVGLLWALTTPLHADGLPAWAEVVYGAFGWALWGVLPLVGLIFPTGRIQGRFGVVLGWTLCVFITLATIAQSFSADQVGFSGVINPLAHPGLQPVVQMITGVPGVAVFFGCIVGIIVDLALRWRRSDGVTRLQYRWLFYGLTVSVTTVVVAGVAIALSAGAEWSAAVAATGLLVTNLIPLSIGIAVTRHGLFEIGRVVSRTVAYAAVTAITIAMYVLVVTSVTLLLPEAPAVAVGGATLVAAAVFLPVLHAVQRLVDRRFDRERYDARHVVDAYGERLRTEVDPGAAAAGLRSTVESALQPASVGLWLAGRS